MNTIMDLQDQSDQRDVSHPHLYDGPVVGLRFALAGLLAGGLLPGLVWAISGALWGSGFAWVVGFYAVALSLAGWAFYTSYPHRQIGLCNVVTIVRLALISSLVAAFSADTVSVVAMLIIASVAFALDGVDGWLARRTKLSSRFGARFDVEVDSIFALLLACLAVQSGLHPLVILLGLPRYAFGVAQFFFPFLNGSLSERFSRKLVCVVQIAVLVLLIVPWIDPAARHAMAALASGLVIWSFAVDIVALARVRA